MTMALTLNARSISGTPDTSANDRDPMTNRSMWRTPSAASAGTIRREPALESPEVPASTKTVMVLVRIKWHAPFPTAIDSTNTSPGPGDCAYGRNTPTQRPTISEIVTNQPRNRDVRWAAIHAATHAIKATTVHHTSGRPVPTAANVVDC